MPLRLPDRLVNTMSAREALELHLADFCESKIAGALGQVAQRRRDQYFPAMRQRCDSRGENYRLAEEVRGFVYGLADMQPYPHPNRSRRILLAGEGEGPLDCDRAEEGPPRAGESGHEAIAHRFHFVTFVQRHLLADKSVVCTHDFLR